MLGLACRCGRRRGPPAYTLPIRSEVHDRGDQQHGADQPPTGLGGYAMSLVRKLIYLETFDGEAYPDVCVTDEDEQSITITFQNVPTMIPRSRIKMIQEKGSC